jgi:transcriptional regulator with XRE-family HTH domain
MGDLKRRFGNFVASHRKRIGWTQHQLADAASLSDDMVARLETGSTGASFETIERLADALNIDPAELFTSELPGGAVERGPAARLVSKILALKADDVLWLEGVVDAALKRRP